MPQFILEVKAMACPLIPPGKISLSTSQGTTGKGRGGGEQQNDQKAIETEGQPMALRPSPAWPVVGEQGRVLSAFVQRSEEPWVRLTVAPELGQGFKVLQGSQVWQMQMRGAVGGATYLAENLSVSPQLYLLRLWALFLNLLCPDLGEIQPHSSWVGRK